MSQTTGETNCKGGPRACDVCRRVLEIPASLKQTDARSKTQRTSSPPTSGPPEGWINGIELLTRYSADVRYGAKLKTWRH
jgi:hypothetical protein